MTFKSNNKHELIFKEVEQIQYPSISICKKYAIEGGSILYDESFDINTVVESYRNKTQSLNEQIYFFTHPGIMNLTFPCTTILGGRTPGRPCVFPVTYLFGYLEPYFSNISVLMDIC